MYVPLHAAPQWPDNYSWNEEKKKKPFLLPECFSLLSHDSMKKKETCSGQCKHVKTCQRAHALPLVQVNVKMTTADTKWNPPNSAAPMPFTTAASKQRSQEGVIGAAERQHAPATGMAEGQQAPPSLYLEHCSHSSRRLRGGRRRDRIVVAGAPRCSCWLERSATRNLTQSNRKGLQAPRGCSNTGGPLESTTATFHVLAKRTHKGLLWLLVLRRQCRCHSNFVLTAV